MNYLLNKLVGYFAFAFPPFTSSSSHLVLRLLSAPYSLEYTPCSSIYLERCYHQLRQPYTSYIVASTSSFVMMRYNAFPQGLQMSLVGATDKLTRSFEYPLNLQRIQDFLCSVSSTFFILSSTSFMKHEMQSGLSILLVSMYANWNSSPSNGH